MKLSRGLDQDRENFAHFTLAASRKQTNQVRIAWDVDLACRGVAVRRLVFPQPLNHWVADKNRAKTALIVEISFKRKDAEHQIEPAGHLFDPATIPGPDLRADVIDDLLA